MAPPVEAMLKDSAPDISDVGRVAHRRIKSKLEVVEPNPAWSAIFQGVKAKIVAALGPAALEIHHAGSTSVPGLPAKDVIDVDLVVADTTDEASYVPQLEAEGFHFLFREPAWHEHRFIVLYEPVVNLHVFGPNCPEVERHRLFREWLVAHPDDKELYANAKKAAMAISSANEETIVQYNSRKEGVIKQILGRVFKAQGWTQ
jgi:GrpB-like predicted nucleotidyltransferase (UPF0157 family)